MDMAKRPVVVATAGQFRQFARGVGRVGVPALQGGVKQRDVEHPRRRRAIAGGEVVVGRRRCEALAMERDPELGQGMGAAGFGVEHHHALRHFQVPGDAVLSVVVAVDDEDLNPRRGKASELLHRKEARAHLPPGPVVKVASNDDEGGLLLDRKVHQIRKRRPGRVPYPADRLAVRSRQPDHRAVEMNIGRRKEGKIAHQRGA